MSFQFQITPTMIDVLKTFKNVSAESFHINYFDTSNLDLYKSNYLLSCTTNYSSNIDWHFSKIVNESEILFVDNIDNTTDYREIVLVSTSLVRYVYTFFSIDIYEWNMYGIKGMYGFVKCSNIETLKKIFPNEILLYAPNPFFVCLAHIRYKGAGSKLSENLYFDNSKKILELYPVITSNDNNPLLFLHQFNEIENEIENDETEYSDQDEYDREKYILEKEFLN